jgi:hypothetical protein
MSSRQTIPTGTVEDRYASDLQGQREERKLHGRPRTAAHASGGVVILSP